MKFPQVFHEEPVSVATPSATLFSVPRLNPGVVKYPDFSLFVGLFGVYINPTTNKLFCIFGETIFMSPIFLKDIIRFLREIPPEFIGLFLSIVIMIIIVLTA